MNLTHVCNSAVCPFASLRTWLRGWGHGVGRLCRAAAGRSRRNISACIDTFIHLTDKCHLDGPSFVKIGRNNDGRVRVAPKGTDKFQFLGGVSVIYWQCQWTSMWKKIWWVRLCPQQKTLIINAGYYYFIHMCIPCVLCVGQARVTAVVVAASAVTMLYLHHWVLAAGV